MREADCDNLGVEIVLLVRVVVLHFCELQVVVLFCELEAVVLFCELQLVVLFCELQLVVLFCELPVDTVAGMGVEQSECVE